jgi:RecA/RadA recombinase
MSLQDTINKLRDGINKDLGKKVALNLSVDEIKQVDQWIPMPDWFKALIGEGEGIPCGHITQIIGETDTGKTSLTIQMMIACQKAGGIVFMIDSEHKFPWKRFTRFGGDINAVVPMVVDSLEEAWTAFDSMIDQVKLLRKTDKELPILMVWDSIAASIPDAILEGEAGQSHVAVQAKQNNQEVLKFRQAIRRYNVAAVLINHSYFEMGGYGAPKEIIKGGKELGLQSTFIIKCQKMGWIDRTQDKVKQIIGVKTKLRPFKGHLSDIKGVVEVFMCGDTVDFLSNTEALKDAKERFDEVMSGVKVDTVEEKEAKTKRTRKAKDSENEAE